ASWSYGSRSPSRRIVSSPESSFYYGRELAIYLPRPAVAVDLTKVHDAGTASAVGVIFSGVRLFFVSRLLKLTRSTSSIVFHAFTVAVNPLQPDSHVSTSALLGGMSMPFCASGARTVLNVALIELNGVTLPGALPPAGRPKPPPPPPRPPRTTAPPNVASFASSAVAAVATSGGSVPRASAANCARAAATSSLAA